VNVARGFAGKIFLASTLLVAAVLGVAFGVTSLQANRTADALIGRALQHTQRAAESLLAGRTSAIARMSRVSAGVPQFRERLLTSRERTNALDQAQEYRDQVGAAWVLVADDEGILIARTDYPDQSDLDYSRAPLVATALSGEQSSGAWLDDARQKLFIAVGTPLQVAPTAAPQGALVTAYDLNDSLAAAIKEATSTDVVFFLLDTLNRPVVVGSTLPPLQAEIGPLLTGIIPVDSLAVDTAGLGVAAELDREHVIGRAGAIRSPAGDLRGGFVVFRSREGAPELAAFHALRRSLVPAIGLGIVLALVSAVLLARPPTSFS